MSRPALLTAGVVVLLVVAGCTGPAAGPDGTTTTAPTSDGSTTTLGDRTTTTPTTDHTTSETTTERARTATDRGHYRKFEFRVRSVTPEQLARDAVTARETLDLENESFDRALFRNGSARTPAIVHEDHASNTDDVGPIDGGELVRWNGTYYRANQTVLDRRASTGYRVEFEGPLREEFDQQAYERAKRQAVNYSTLSAVDQRIFQHVAPGEEHYESATTYASQFWAFPTDVDPEEATLVDGEVHYVRYQDYLFRVRIDGERPPVVRVSLRYDLERVASSDEEFARSRLDTHVTPLNESVPKSPRSVLQRAIDESGFAWEGTHRTVPQNYRDTEDWLHDQPPRGRTAYVRYEGTIYRIHLYKVVE